MQGRRLVYQFWYGCKPLNSAQLPHGVCTGRDMVCRVGLGVHTECTDCVAWIQCLPGEYGCPTGFVPSLWAPDTGLVLRMIPFGM